MLPNSGARWRKPNNIPPVQSFVTSADVLLLYPPVSQCRSPHLALPLLKAYLRSQGIACDIVDLNLQCFRHVMQPARLQRAVTRIEQRLLAGGSGSLGQDSLEASAQLAFLHWDYVRPRLTASMDLLSQRTPRPLDDPMLRQAEQVVRLAYQILSTEFFPVRWEEDVYAGGFDAANCRDLMRAAGEVETNPFTEYDEEADLERTLDLAARRVIGISICYQSQLVASLTLARFLRRRLGPEAIIVLGGPVSMYMRRNPQAILPLFEWVSGVVFGEGEAPLVGLHRIARGCGSLREVPALLFREGDCVQQTEPRRATRLNELPRPSFDQLPLDAYVCNRLELPVFSERGCYYGQCAFCCVDLSPDRRFDSRRAELLVDDIVHYREAHGATHVLLITTALPAAKALDFSNRLIERQVEIRWGSNVRYENRFTEAILGQMRASGCVSLNVGLESGSERIVAAMKKGFTIEEAVQFHARAAGAGIRMGLYIMLGFPGETDDDRAETVRVLKELNLRLEDLSIGQFVLHEFAPMFENPQAYGIEVEDSGDQLPFQRTFHYADGRPLPEDLVTPFRAQLSTSLEPALCAADGSDLDLRQPLEMATPILIREAAGSPMRFLILAESDGTVFEVEDRLFVETLRLADGENSIEAISRGLQQPTDRVRAVVSELMANRLVAPCALAPTP